MEAEQQADDCDGNCLIDTDLDSICDEFEVEGCTDSIATNFNPLATDDDGCSMNISKLKGVQILSPVIITQQPILMIVRVFLPLKDMIAIQIA